MTQVSLVAQIKNLPPVCETPSCSIPESGRFPGEGNGNPLQYSYLENPMDRGVGWATAHGSLRIRPDWATSTFLSTKWHTHGARRVTRPTIKGQKVGGVPSPRNPHPFSKIVRLFLPLLSLWNYPAPQINHPTFGAYLLSSEISHILSMECASNTYTLLSCSWMLPCRKLRTLTWWPIPGTHQRSGAWLSNHTFIFLHQRFWVPSPHRLW